MKTSIKLKKIFSAILVCLLVVLSCPLASLAQVQDEFEFSIITNKENYTAKEQIEVSMVAKNISAEPLYNVCLKADVPSGFKIEGEQKDYKKISVLNPNETLEFTSVLRQKSVVIETPKTGDSKVTLFITLGVMLLVWVALAIIVKINDRKARGMLSMVLCIALAGGSAFVVADAATSYVKAEKTITVDGKTVTVGGIAEYAKEGSLNTPQVSETDIPKIELGEFLFGGDGINRLSEAIDANIKTNSEYKAFIEKDGLIAGIPADYCCEHCGNTVSRDQLDYVVNSGNKAVVLFDMCIGESVEKTNLHLVEHGFSNIITNSSDGVYNVMYGQQIIELTIKAGCLSKFELLLRDDEHGVGKCGDEYEPSVPVTQVPTPQVSATNSPKIDLSDYDLRELAKVLGTDVKANSEYKEYLNIDGLFVGIYADYYCKYCGDLVSYDFENEIINKGNKNVTLLGMCIGDSLEETKKHLAENYVYFPEGVELAGDGEYLGWLGESAFEVTIKNGYLVAYGSYTEYTGCCGSSRPVA